MPQPLQRNMQENERPILTGDCQHRSILYGWSDSNNCYLSSHFLSQRDADLMCATTLETATFVWNKSTQHPVQSVSRKAADNWQNRSTVKTTRALIIRSSLSALPFLASAPGPAASRLTSQRIHPRYSGWMPLAETVRAGPTRRPVSTSRSLNLVSAPKNGPSL